MKRLAFTAAGGLLGIASVLLAHHSWGAFYDLNQQVVLKGKVANVAFKDPHVILTIETKDSGIWETELTSGFKRGGISEGTLKVGDFVEVLGSPPLDSKRHVVAALWEISRASDGSRWLSGATWAGPRVIE